MGSRFATSIVRMVRRLIMRRFIPARLGAYIDGTYTYDVPGDNGAVYLTLLRGKDTEVVTAVNYGSIPNPNLIVYAEKVHGDYVVVFPVPRSAKGLYGKLAPSSSVPPHMASQSGALDPVSGERIEVGKVYRHQNGGLWVLIRGLNYDNKNVKTDSALQLTAPTTSGKVFWAIVCLNTRTDTFVQISTSEASSVTLADLYAYDLQAYLVPLAAIQLAYGQTEISSAADIVDLRYHITGKPVNDTKLPFIATQDAESVTISSGSLAFNQTLILVVPESGTTDTLSTMGIRNGAVAILTTDSANTITINNAGNIATKDGDDFTLDGDQFVVAVCYDDVWRIIADTTPPGAIASTILDKIITDEDGNIVVDEDGNVVYEE